jgi:hypothetical protein
VGQSVAGDALLGRSITLDHAEVLELAEPRGQDRSADSGQSLCDGIEAERSAQQQLANDDKAPPIAQVLDGLGERTVVAGFHHGRILFPPANVGSSTFELPRPRLAG